MTTLPASVLAPPEERARTVAAEGSVTLVVCTYTAARLRLLRGLLASVRAADPRPDEVIVVVDRDKALHERLRVELDPGTTVLFSPDGGLSGARNTGWRAAVGDWVAFVDDDAIVAPDWLGVLRAGSAGADAEIGGGRIEPRWDRGAPGWYTDRLGWVVGCTFTGMPERTAPVRSVIGCNMLVRRSTLERLDGFVTGLGRAGGALIGSEETELCIRAGSSGGKVVFVPDSRAWQMVPAERHRMGYAWRRAVGEGRSKARLAMLHGRVLGVEDRYARALVRDAAARCFRGLRRREAIEIQRGSALLAVLAATVAGYAAERLRGASRRSPSAP